MKIEISTEKDNKDKWIRISIGKEIIEMSLGEWSKLLANPLLYERKLKLTNLVANV